MNYTEALEYTHSLSRFGWILGLDRIGMLLDRVGNPQKNLKFIHIAGTNGKGSAAAYCASILQKAGYRTGIYTSPYILDFRERIRIDGGMIAEEDYAAVASAIKSHADRLTESGHLITEFEFVTAAAFYYFNQMDCDIVCLEVGLGGRYDATNIIGPPEVAVITKISLDHTDVLGDTITKIAAEKAQIIKPGSVCVSYPMQEQAAMDVIAERCSETDVRLILPDLSLLDIQETTTDGCRFSYEGISYHTPLRGEFQIYNALTAIGAVTALDSYTVSPQNIIDGIGGVYIPARLEIIGNIILDSAHNPDGMKALADALAKMKISPDVLVIGMLADKNYAESAGNILPSCKRVITTAIDHPRELPPDRLAAVIPGAISVPCNTEAIKRAKELCGDGMILVCGSMMLVSEICRNHG